MLTPINQGGASWLSPTEDLKTCVKASAVTALMLGVFSYAHWDKQVCNGLSCATPLATIILNVLVPLVAFLAAVRAQSCYQRIMQ